MKYYAGVDLGATYLKCGIIAGDGTLLCRDKIPTCKDRSAEEIAADTTRLVAALAQRANITLSGVGIGAPGTVDSRNGVVVYSNNLRWNNVPFARTVQNGVNAPVFAVNEANAAALGEQFCGAGKPYRDVVFLTLGTGIGSGIVIDGKLYEGNKSAGAEIGHTVISLGGEKCTCGRRGCFEAYASAAALIRQTVRAMKRHEDSKMWEVAHGDLNAVDGKTPFVAMRLGDRAAASVVENYVEYLSEGIANLCNEFRPEAVLLGGGIGAEGETLLRPLSQAVEQKIYGGAEYAPVEILQATLGGEAGMYGAARYAMLRQA